jgi:hypothetical protein
MSAKKQVSAKVAIGLGVIVVALIIVLAAVFVSPTTFNLENSKRAPSLLIVGQTKEDRGPSNPNNPSLRVTGWLVNAGDNTSYNTKIHIVAYNTNSAKVIDYYPLVGTGMIKGHEATQFDELIYYSGPSLAAGTISIEAYWENSP